MGMIVVAVDAAVVDAYLMWLLLLLSVWLWPLMLSTWDELLPLSGCGQRVLVL